VNTAYSYFFQRFNKQKAKVLLSTLKPIRFITFEGPEGAGKTTQCKLLADWLTRRGENVLVTRQPGGDPVGAKLREILLSSDEAPIAPSAELLMMMADRAQSVAHIIRPHLEKGGMALCDRYIDSSMAYQGYGRGIDIESVERLNRFATGGLLPDLTIFIDIDPAEGLSRQERQNRMEGEGLIFHRKVHDGFIEIAKLNPDRVVRIDGKGGIDEIQLKIRNAYETHHCHSSGAR
jgi:dTMP kinase